MIVPSLAKPGGNITGLSGYSTDLEAKRVEVLREGVPGIKRLAGMYNMSNPVVPAQWQQIQKSAQALDVKAQLLDVRNRDDIVAAFQTAIEQRADALVVGVDALTQEFHQLIAELTIKNRVPAMFVSREWVEAGGLFAYGPSYPDLYRRAASYVDRVLKGAIPGDLPIEQPTKFELVVNLKTSKALGLTVPSSILARADEVIE